MNILVLFQPIQNSISKTTLRQLSQIMVDISQVLMCQYRQDDPDFSVLEAFWI